MKICSNEHIHMNVNNIKDHKLFNDFVDYSIERNDFITINVKYNRRYKIYMHSIGECYKYTFQCKYMYISYKLRNNSLIINLDFNDPKKSFTNIFLLETKIFGYEKFFYFTLKKFIHKNYKKIKYLYLYLTYEKEIPLQVRFDIQRDILDHLFTNLCIYNFKFYCFINHFDWVQGQYINNVINTNKFNIVFIKNEIYNNSRIIKFIPQYLDNNNDNNKINDNNKVNNNKINNNDNNKINNDNNKCVIM